MWSAILGAIVKPVTNLIDELHTSDEEKGQLRAAILAVQVDMGTKLLEYETARMQMQTDVIKAEAKSGNLLTSAWRPVTMLVFLGLVVAYFFGWQAPNFNEAMSLELFGLIKIGLGGYVIGRSAEKVVPQVAQMFKSKVSG